MCEEPTLTASKRGMLGARLRAAQEALTANAQVTKAIGTATTALARARQAMEQAGIRGVGTHDRSLLETLLSGKPDALRAFLTAYDELVTAVEASEGAATALSEYLSRIPERLADIGRASELIADSTAVPARFAVAADALKSKPVFNDMPAPGARLNQCFPPRSLPTRTSQRSTR